jgi:hypothetical protein
MEKNLLVRCGSRLTGISVTLMFLGLICSNVTLANSSKELTIRENSASERGESDRLAQSQLPEYVCQQGLEQTNLSPPTANYKSSITCGRGTPVTLKIDVYKANVNVPTRLIYVGSNSFTCKANPCVSPNYSRTIDQTQFLYVDVTANVRGATTGVVYSDPRSYGGVTRPYNRRGEMYPQIQPSRSDMEKVPFPATPYDRIMTITNAQRADFRKRAENLYNSEGWTIPPAPYQAHHIKPILQGGNNETYNAVLLGATTHSLFTRWWTGFDYPLW